ncbi:MAG: hypothetical protein Q9M27_00450 [Mariprofundaceae bacterium]|nr:hypothetical protein [Mariprofundaceae bacterium]
MARPLRIEFAGAVYHVTSRGDHREAIVENDEERREFVKLLYEFRGQYTDFSHSASSPVYKGFRIAVTAKYLNSERL